MKDVGFHPGHDNMGMYHGTILIRTWPVKIVKPPLFFTNRVKNSIMVVNMR